MNVESMYEYGSRAGFWRLWRMFTSRNMPVTVFGIATALARNPEAVAAMREARWEIASHGLKWIDYKDVPEAQERADLAEAIRIHTQATGERPLGWYTGRTSVNSLKAVLDEGGFVYSSDSYADDLPYWVQGPKGPHLIIPYTLVRQPAGLRQRRRVLRLSQGCIRVSLCRRRARAQDDVGRAALPAGRAARPRRRAGAIPRPHRRPPPGVDRDPARHRPALAPRACRPRGERVPGLLSGGEVCGRHR
jgi:hypothetical protein